MHHHLSIPLYATCLMLLIGCGPEESGTQSTASPHKCQPYPIERAEELITNSDTGERKIDGQIVAACSVISNDTFVDGRGQNAPIHVIAINVDGQIITLLLGSDDPLGNGLYSSVDQVSENATGFPQNRRIGSESTDGVKTARASVAKGND